MLQRFVASAAILGLILSSTFALAAPEKAPGYLGVLTSKAEDGKSGARIREVTPDSPAAKAGLQNGDLVIRVGDQEIKDAEGLTSAIRGHIAGDKLTLWVQRDGKEQKLGVTLGERPARPGREESRSGNLPIAPKGAYLGVNTQELTPELKQRLNLAADKGAMITDVMPETPAAKAGLKAEDVIVAVGDKEIGNPAELREAITSNKPGSEVLLKVMRGKEKMDVKATLAESPVAFDFGELQLPEQFKSLFEDGKLQPFKFDFKDLHDGRLPMDIKKFTFDLNQVQEMQKRIEELEKRIAELEKQLKK
jgi:C-terminal processing protease CtpA/Prc